MLKLNILACIVKYAACNTEALVLSSLNVAFSPYLTYFSNYLDKLHEVAHLERVEAHLAMQSSQGRQGLHQLNALVEARMHRAEDQERIKGLRAVFRGSWPPKPHRSPASVQLAAPGAAFAPHQPLDHHLLRGPVVRRL